MPSFSRGILFLLFLLAAALTQHSAAATLDAEERQKEEQDHETALKDGSRALGAPEPPQSIEVFPQSDTVILVTWKEPSDTTDLDHYYMSVEGEDDMVVTTTEKRYFWTDLQPCKNYTFGVSSVSATGDMSDPILGDGRTDTELPPPPQNLQGESQSSTTMTLTWDKPDTLCDIDYYQVKWSLDGTNTSKQVTDTSFPVTNLLPNTTYIFSVSAYTSYGGGDEASIEETTIEEKPGPPQDLQAVGVSPYAINVSWSEPDIPPKYYKVEGLPCIYLSEQVFGLWYLIDGLDPCTACSITVTSMYDDDMTYYERIIGETLAGDPPVLTNCFVNSAEGAITVSWARPDSSNCALGKYHVQWMSTKLWGDGGEESDGLNTTATHQSIYDPVPYSEYTFEISSSIEGVFGSPTSCNGTSLETLPGPPVILGVESLQGEARVAWETPAEENGVIKKYGIFVDEETDPRNEVDGTEHSASVVDLTPCVRVSFSVKAFNNAGWGPRSDIEYVTVPDDVLPEEVNCKAYDRVVKICWMPYSESCPVSRYNLNWEGDVLWSDDLADANNTTMNWTSTEICYNISAVPYTKYLVELSVGSNGGERTCSALTPMASPGPPTEVGRIIENLVITVTWSEPEEKNGIIEKYQIEWKDSAGVLGSLTTGDNSTFSIDIIAQDCGVTVDVTVRAKVVDVDTVGAESPAPTAFLFNSVDALSCFPSEPRQLSLKWTLVYDECSVTLYNLTWIYYSLWSNDSGDGWQNAEGTALSAIVNSLPPYADVFLQIHVDNNSECKECRATTLEEAASPPTGLVPVAVDSTSITVQWSLPEFIRGRLLGWSLYWTSALGQILGDVHITDPEIRVHTIVDLVPGKVYDVYVMAINSAGNGEAAMLEVDTVYEQEEKIKK